MIRETDLPATKLVKQLFLATFTATRHGLPPLSFALSAMNHGLPAISTGVLQHDPE
jgi:hypothetical protein